MTDTTLPLPPPCPLCGEHQYVRERFFPQEDRWPTKEVVILSRCTSCGLKRFMLPSGGLPGMRTRGSLTPVSLRRLLRAMRKRGERGLVVVPTGTDPVWEANVIQWSSWPRGEALDWLFFLFSLEERLDALDVLREARGRLKVGGMLFVMTTNSSSWLMKLMGITGQPYEPTRQRVLFNRRTLRVALERAGYPVVRVAWKPLRTYCVGIAHPA